MNRGIFIGMNFCFDVSYYLQTYLSFVLPS